ncbi:MAG: hypothetical protein LBK97_01705 [Prevotellaceae bacterium]|jgi:hypothetical protein|nr:hypothetical protein [Prevotellaceae bacterium]
MNLRTIKYIVAILSGCAATVGCIDSGSNFAVQDIENISRIELSDRNDRIVLSKTGDGEWLASSFKANMQNVSNLMTILSGIEVRYPLPKMYDSAYPCKKIIDEGILVKAFKGKKTVKSYYLLTTGEDNVEAIGLTDEKQKPYVLELPGRDIEFGDYIVMEPSFWENNILFSLNAGQIKYLKIENMETPCSSFSIKVADSIFLYDMQGKNILFNRFKMEAYLSYFNSISFDSNLNIPDDEKQQIRSTAPLYVMTVESDTDSLTCYINPIADSRSDDYGNPLVYDRDFFYLIVPQKNLFAKACWLKFDILLEEPGYFQD